MRFAEPTSARRPSTTSSLAWSTAPAGRRRPGQRQRRSTGDRAERLGLWPGVRAGAVFLGLEDDVDLAAPLDCGLEVGGELGERVGGEADEQYALARVSDELVKHGGRQALIARRAGSGPDRSRSSRVRVAAGAQPDAQGERDAVPGE